MTELRWHGRRDPEYHAEAILYTASADKKLRVWAATDTHGLQALQLWAELDLMKCMLPEIQPSPDVSEARYVFIIDNWEYEALVERVTHRSSNTEKDQETLKRLVDVAYRDPDICVVLDDKGNMSAWGLERVGCKARHANDVFKIAQVKGVDMHCPKDVEVYEDYATCLSFGGLGDGCEVNLLIHFFDGRIQWLTCPIDRLFYQEPEFGSFVTEALWTGHTEVIEELVTSHNGRYVLSRSSGNEMVFWKQGQNPVSAGLERAALLSSPRKVEMAMVVDGGEFVITIDDELVSIWDVRSAKAVQMSSQHLPAGFDLSGCVVSTAAEENALCSVMLVSKTLQGIMYGLTSTDQIQAKIERRHEASPIPHDRSICSRLIQPSQSSAYISALSVEQSGEVFIWKLKNRAGDEPAGWTIDHSLGTGIKDISDVATSCTLKLAVLDATRTKLTIWDMRGGGLEMSETFDAHDTIGHLSWTSTHDGNTILAVSFTHKIYMYAQLPYELSETGSLDAWIKLREININELTNLPISSCIWLAGGDLLLSAGNQMFLFDKEIDSRTAYDLGLPIKSKQRQELFKVVSAMNFTLPLFHPQFVRQCLISGKFDLVHKILRNLYKALRYYTEGDKLDSFLSLDVLHDVARISTHRTNQSSRDYVDHEDQDDLDITEQIADQLKDQLSSTRLPHLPTTQKDELIRIIQSLGISQRQQKSVDTYGFQYLTLAKDYFLQPEEPQKLMSRLSWREIVSAYYTVNQDILVDMTSRQYQGRMLWKDARQCGICLWLADVTALVCDMSAIREGK